MAGDFIFDGESMSNSLLGDDINPKPLVGELNTEGPRLGVNFRRGVDVTLLLQLGTSARTCADLARSKRGLFADRFSGEPFSMEPQSKSKPESANTSGSSARLLKTKGTSSKLKLGLHGGRLSSRQVSPRTGEPTNSRTLSL
jgi:hypothetical protein